MNPPWVTTPELAVHQLTPHANPMRAIAPARSVLLVVALLAALSATAHAQGYTVTDLGSLSSGRNRVWDLNDRGEVTGYSDVQGVYQAYRWTPARGMRGLGTTPGTSASYGIGINDAGHVAGTSGLSFENSRGFLNTGGRQLRDLGDLGGMETWVRGLDNHGRVVGESRVPSGTHHAVLWQAGVLTDLNAVLGATSSEARAISDTGFIVGLADGAPFLLRSGRVTYLPDLGARANVTDVNDFGVAVGWSAKANGVGCTSCDTRAVMWRGGQIVELGVLAPPTASAMTSSAMGVNNLGQVVGYSTTSPLGTHHGFVWDEASGMRDLNDLVPPGWNIEWALAINDAGQIAANGFFGTMGTPRALLLDPIDARPVLINPQPGVAGGTNRFDVLGASPGGLVAFVAGTGFGSLPLPFCGTVLQVASPLVLGGVTADGTGTARLDLLVPASLDGASLVFQALDLAGCEVTAVAVQTF